MLVPDRRYLLNVHAWNDGLASTIGYRYEHADAATVGGIMDLGP